MTSELRTFIEIGDIEALEFECPNCHTRIVQPVELVETDKQKGLPYKCSICEKTIIAAGSTVADNLKQFVTFLRQFRKDLPVPVRFQLRSPNQKS